MNFPEAFAGKIDVSGDPEFPPVFNGMAVAGSVDVVDHAVDGVFSGRLGAGDLCWSQCEDRAALAIVLEPDVPLEKAAQVVLLFTVAIGDAIGAIGPPNLALTYRWPDRILANGAEIGKVRAVVAPRCSSGDVPQFLIIGCDLAIAAGSVSEEPGHDLQKTYLYEEGAGDLNRTLIVEAIARHFLSWLDGWQQEGFAGVHHAWMAKANDKDETVAIRFGDGTVEGAMLGLDEQGGLLLKTVRGAEVIPLYETGIEDAGGHG